MPCSLVCFLLDQRSINRNYLRPDRSDVRFPFHVPLLRGVAPPMLPILGVATWQFTDQCTTMEELGMKQTRRLSSHELTVEMSIRHLETNTQAMAEREGDGGEGDDGHQVITNARRSMLCWGAVVAIVGALTGSCSCIGLGDTADKSWSKFAILDNVDGILYGMVLDRRVPATTSIYQSKCFPSMLLKLTKTRPILTNIVVVVVV